MANFIKSDLEFILQQIFIAEAHANGEDLANLLPNAQVPFGLRTVDGSYNNLLDGQSAFGAADGLFPRLLDPVFRPAEGGTSYAGSGSVVDSQPRTISNLIVDQTANNPAAVEANGGAPSITSPGLDGIFGTADDRQVFFIPNESPDEGLSAGFNAWMTFFGQFFDHGLDLVTKSGTEVVFIPLQADDPLVAGADGQFGTADDLAPNLRFMVVSRATNQPGPDGQLGTADDVHEHTNTTSPFVDQNQTYSSHPSHQVFLREYVLDANGQPVATGRLITNRDPGLDGQYYTDDDQPIGGMATWAVVKAQAQKILGINLTDADVFNVPLLATDAYGNFVKGDNGFPLVVMSDNSLVEGNLAAPVSLANAVHTGHAFLDDIAHSATPTAGLTADLDDVAGNAPAAGTYDNELLDAHYIAGDGRVNENIGLTTVHHVFHAEHNRLVEQSKETILASNDLAFINQWLLEPIDSLADLGGPLVWNGERLFQAAKFGTEMQYQHLVFEEFARTIQPQIDEFLAPTGYDTTIDPSIVAEFAHTVYRFGHSMLTETVDRYDADFNVIGADPNNPDQQMGLIAAFLNPLAFAASGPTPEEAAGAIVRGLTRQLGNEIDEFVTEALRNNLLGLPLDLPAINIARGRDAGIPSLNQARREFFEMTGDNQLKPYLSWADFAAHLKHPASLINFIAAYGTHDSITGATTLEGKRAAAVLLVLGGTGEPGDRLDFLNSTGAWASGANGATITGLDAVDFWIGGLAEAKMPFGGMLGSSFNFVFETQLEALQNGDRFYYLSRTAGMNFGTELENNSFAKMVMLHTDAIHLSNTIFQTPTFTLEVDQSRQFNAGLDGDDPTGGITINGVEVTPLVIRDNPETAGPDGNYLRYTGGDHVVMGGTDGDDVIVSGAGDDTVWGDAGNDRLEGGAGNDAVLGGDGDDIISDMFGDNRLEGGAGNDVIVVGSMEAGGAGNLILGGDGQDFIIITEDISTTFGGQGDDFILSPKTSLPPTGNEGDDWIEMGTQDGAPGDNFAPLLTDEVNGNDIFVGGPGFDEMIGEGGDDIFVGSDAQDKMEGMSGFDWVTHKNDKVGVTVDLTLAVLAQPHGNLPTENNGIFQPVGASPASILDRFDEVEGASGSRFGDIIRGDNVNAETILNHGGATGSALTNVDLIDGLRELLQEAGLPTNGFATGNILLGGDGSDIIEGRGGDDLIDGDKWLNVRIAVYAADDVDHTGPEIDSFNSMTEMIPLMLAGTYSPGQLKAVREILPGTSTGGAAYDTAVFSGNRVDYTIEDRGNGVFRVTDNVGDDGSDTLVNIERLQFSDQTVELAGGNASPTGRPTLSDSTGGQVSVGDMLTVSMAGVQDADNVTGSNPNGNVSANSSVSFIWQVERDPGTGVFEDIILLPAGDLAFQSADGSKFRVTSDLAGLNLRVKALYQDGHGTTEMVFSQPTGTVQGSGDDTPVAHTPVVDGTTSGVGFQMVRSDLNFILDQIRIAEAHARGEDMLSLLPNIRVPFGLRTVDGSSNNLFQQNGIDNTEFGAADNTFPRIVDPDFRDAENGSSYTQTSGLVFDSQPRTISNLLVDQTANNPAAYASAYDPGTDGILNFGTPGNDDVLKEGVQIVKSPGLDGQFGTGDDKDVFLFPNVAPDEGLSAPFNAWMTFFGQFFDHGLDLVTKGGSGTVFIQLQPDDPLFVEGSPTNFMVLTRATNQPGPDGQLGTADDVHEHTNTTSPFVDQNQTYSSHPSHQVFLREYVMTDNGPIATGHLITNRDPGLDGQYYTGDDVPIGGMATWAVVKAQARELLGIDLTDADVFNVPLLATDAYGNFIKGDNGFPQVVMNGNTLVEGNPDAPVSLANAVRTGHAFLDDIAHNAVPVITGGVLQADADTDIGNAVPVGPGGNNLQYDNELLDAHYIAGDGRVNENIGLTTVHHVFHAEHNRLVAQTKQTVIESGDLDFINEWLLQPITSVPQTQQEVDALVWNGERLFQTAKFGTEMQYQHLVFEEFARTIQPNIDLFFAPTQVYDVDLDASIVAEFAHTVYRFGHSMLTETVDRYDANFNVVGDGNPNEAGNQQMGLIAAFLNPLAFAASGANPDDAAGAIVRGVTRQTGNEIDEFVTEALRNNLLGLPLDLAAINIARGRDTGVPTLNAVRREIYSQTGDAQLKPYLSWADLVLHLKHPESLINFVAAYGTHDSITSATTLLDKRAAALLLVLGGTGEPADRLDFLNGTGAWASVNGITTTGVDAIDLWIGGLAEAKTPFGGMLGSTFNFVFENQLEKLQDGDRFYYLERTAGLSMNAELESNSFAKMIMANTNAIHLPGLVFSTPSWTLEVDQSRQYTGLGTGRDDPDGVSRDNPETAGPDSNFLQYSGGEHVVLGGTEGVDILIAGDGDDTIWGDGGNDIIEGGNGNDQIRGGAGDDIITDIGGDDNIQGGDGNDVIHGGNGINLVMGGFGNDFIVTGEDASEAIGGQGNDFILGSKANEQDMGNEGDDWIEKGTSDGAPGDNFDPLGNDPVIGNDVYIGGGENDKFNGEGGDDIMVGSAGMGNRYIGSSGFDWATFKDDARGVTIDMSDRFFNVPPQPGSGASVLARFDAVEGLSGSHRGDFLRGDSVDAAAIRTAGAYGSVLTNIDLIDGLREFLGEGVEFFDSGNIILGGDGGDLLEGRGGDDLIDGDKWLNVRIAVYAADDVDHSGPEIDSFDSMEPMIPFMLDGTYSAGQLGIVREILDATTPGYDTAVFTGLSTDYTIEIDDNGTFDDTSDDIVRVTDNIVGRDGSDRLTGIERLQFSDTAFDLTGGTGNQGPTGGLAIIDALTGQRDDTPVVGQLLRVSATPAHDADNVSAGNPTGTITGPVSYFWQVETVPGSGVYEDISFFDAGEASWALGETFRVTEDVAGLNIRVRAVYKDANGTLEFLHSVGNQEPNGEPTIDIGFGVPVVGQVLTASIAGLSDPDGFNPATVTLQWQVLDDDLEFVDIGGATGAQFTVTQDQVGRQVRVVANFVDNFGTAESAASLPTQQVDADPTGAPVIEGLAAQGQSLTADTSGIDDADFIFSDFSFQWQQSSDGVNFTNIAGANGATLALGQANVGRQVQVVVSYTDGLGIVETVTSTPTVAVANVNDAPTGAPTVTGTARRGQTLTAQTAGIADIDGLGALSYRWQVSTAGGAFIDIAGANAAAFVLQQGQVGERVRVVTTFVDGGGTEETIFSTPTEIVGDVLNGTAGNDTLIGNVGSDLLNGLGGDDVLMGKAGADTMAGGVGNDTYEVTDAGDSVVELGGEGVDTVWTTLSSYTLGNNVEQLVYSGTGNFTGTGNTLNNYLRGGAGNDVLMGKAGADTMVGGAGNDTYEVTEAGDSVVELGGEGTDTVWTTLSSYTLGNNVEQLVYSGTGNFSGTGNALNNYMRGAAGNDVLIGGAGNDTMVGGAGHDTYEVTEAGDSVVELGGEGTDTVWTRLSSHTLGNNVEQLVYSGTGNFSGTGNALNNYLKGAGGNDVFIGRAGNDTMAGGAGHDTYEVTDAGDSVVELAGEGTDTVWTTLSSYTLGNNVEQLVYSGTGNFTGTGNALNNYLRGGAGNDVLDGGAGNDVVVGGAGNDTMNASLGDDIFVFSAAGFGADRILGFDAIATGGQDRLDISALGITAATFAGNVQINDVGSDTLINIGADSIRLVGVTDATSVNSGDFILAS
ncbi:peroxidase family protein [Pseudomonas jinjuensis]|uniref:Ca2+-binding protein, RTX toxin-related n=1 Tax=Pseudomonas jinjuensis TaxID=198616 RepID=A0A1H0C687_9PSED|nr:peroxidase family protein [Pseudomonas jinjuensis]SDN53347.1 Ca2+-binding protein, RTX toxin-related [Pseudomonas jinjuensis]